MEPVIVIHPQTLDEIICLNPYMPRSAVDTVGGFKLEASYDLARWEIVPASWVFPNDPFVIYEESDVAWCAPLRIGYMKPASFTPGEVLVRNGRRGDRLTARANYVADQIASAMDGLYLFRSNKLKFNVG